MTTWFHRDGTEHKGTVHGADEVKGTAVYTYQDRCSRCGGAGRSDKWMFTGYVCFDCNGSGKGLIRDAKLYTADKLAKLNATQAKREAARAAQFAAEQKASAEAADAKRGAFVAAHGALLDAMRGFPADGFLAELLAKFETSGELSVGQIEAAQKAVARNEERARKAAGSDYVGVVGERREFTVTVEHAIDLAYYPDGEPKPRNFGDFRPPVIYLFRDLDGNRIVYKGQPFFADIYVKFEQTEREATYGRVVTLVAKQTVVRKGETITFKATVKAHEERNGEKQTIVARPKLPAAPPAGEETPAAAVNADAPATSTTADGIEF